jgi:GNAT superfamily N-acetyltransferase
MTTFQLSFLPSLTRQGTWWAQIEAVRADQKLRGQGVGALMIEWAIDQTRERLRDRSGHKRQDAKRHTHLFCRRLGFKSTHGGMKLEL